MELIRITQNRCLKPHDLKNLYDDAGWTIYTRDMKKLMCAINHSHYVATAWEDDRLVGLIRAVGDGETIIYIQDILVLKAYQRKGIGTRLVRNLIEAFPDVRQKVLLTDESPGARAFYESLGFSSCDKGELVAFARVD